MSSVKIVLRKKQNKDNTFPLAIRITKDRKSSFIHLGKHIKESDWDAVNQRVRKSHPNSTRLNNFLLSKLAESNDKLLELETNKDTISSKAVKTNLKSSASSSFFKQAEIYLDNLDKAGKYNRISSEEPRITYFREFLKGEDIAFQDITVMLLNRFRAYLKSVRKSQEITVMGYLATIRTIFNLAISSGIVDAKAYPFGRNKIRIKYPQTSKIGFSVEEVQKLEEVELEPGSYVDHSRNLWLFSFYFAGMRVSDVLRLKWSDFQNDRLHYAMGKNAKTGSLKIPEKAAAIISLYEERRKTNVLVFPDLDKVKDLTDTYEVQKKISGVVQRLRVNLKKVAELAGIDKKLTMHIARHTFGNISGDKISIQMLQKLYRHSTVTTTIGYQANFIHKDADEALDAVVGF